MKKIYTGIDIGSDTIKIVVSEIYKNKLNVLASSVVSSEGVKKGLIVEAELVTKAIKNGLKEIEGMIGLKIDKVVASVPSYFAEFMLVDGYTTINNDNKEVNGNDIVRALQSCVYNKLNPGRELVTVIPLEFILDDKTGIRDPKGFVGTKLGVKAVMITSPKKNIYSVVSILESVGLEVTDITFNAIGDYCEFRNVETDTCVGAIINIGAHTTNVSIFNKGVMIKSEILDIGGKNIDNDIAYIYKLDKIVAKEIKETFAVANKRLASVNEIYETTNLMGQLLKLNQYEISEVVSSRIIEILKLAKKQINVLTNKEISYIMITGGISEMPGFQLVVEEILGKKAYTMDMNSIGIRKNALSSVSGIIRYFYEKLILRGKEYSMFSKEQEEELVSTKKRLLNFSNNSVIGKVFGYFFDNN